MLGELQLPRPSQSGLDIVTLYSLIGSSKVIAAYLAKIFLFTCTWKRLPFSRPATSYVLHSAFCADKFQHSATSANSALRSLVCKITLFTNDVDSVMYLGVDFELRGYLEKLHTSVWTVWRIRRNIGVVLYGITRSLFCSMGNTLTIHI